jgi:chitodextrinase
MDDEPDGRASGITGPLTRRDAIKGLGSIGGLLGLGLSGGVDVDGVQAASGTEDEVPVPSVPQYGWTAQNRVTRYSVQQGSGGSNGTDEKYTTDTFQCTTRLRYVGTDWEQFGNPDGDDDVGGCWRHTFTLASMAHALWNPGEHSVGGISPIEAGLEPNPNENIENKFEAEAMDNADSVALSARRNDDMLTLMPGGPLASSLQSNQYGGGASSSYAPITEFETTEAERFRAVRTIEAADSSGLLTQSATLWGLGTGSVSLAAKIPVEGRVMNMVKGADDILSKGAGLGAALSIYSALAELTDGGTQPVPVTYNRGFVSAISKKQRGPAAGHYVAFDVYVSPGETGSFRIKSMHSSSEYGDQENVKPEWEVEIGATPAPDDTWNPEIPRGDRFTAKIVAKGASGSRTNVTDGPIATFAKPPEAITSENGELPAETDLTFAANDTVRGGAPISDWAWTVEDRASGERIDTGNDTRETPRLTVSFPSQGTYDVSLTVTDERDEESTASKVVTVGNALPSGTIEAPDPDDGSVSVGTSVSFEATVDDAETPTSDLDVTWRASRPYDADDETIGTGTSTTHTFDREDNPVVDLVVEDADVEHIADQVTLTVVNELPSGEVTSPTGSEFEVGESIQFEASASDPDTDTSELQFEWRDYYEREHPESKDYRVLSESQSFEYAFEFSGTKSVECFVTDGQGWVSLGSVELDITAPIAGAIEQPTETTFEVDESITFEGAPTDGTPADDYDYEWTFVEATDAETTAEGREVTRSFDDTGDHEVQLYMAETGSSEFVPVDRMPLTIQEKGSGPTAIVSVSPDAPNPGQTVTFDGSASTGTDLTYSWTIDGATDDDAVVERSFADTGTYTASLTVTDGNDDTDTTSIDVTVEPAPEPPENVAPDAQIQVPGSVEIDTTVTIDGTASSDPDGTIVSYEWRIDGERYTEPSVTESFASPGKVAIELTVTDDDDATDTASATLTVEENEPPVARIDAPDTAPVGEQVTFDGSGSSDPDGSIMTHQWRIGEESPTGETVSRPFESPGEYSVSLSVTDTGGAVDTANTDITIEEDGDGPTARATVSPDPARVGQTVTFDASDSTGDGGGTGVSLDFEDGSLDGFEGRLDRFEVQSGFAQQGERALEGVSDPAIQGVSRIYSQAHTLGQGDTFEHRFAVDDGNGGGTAYEGAFRFSWCNQSQDPDCERYKLAYLPWTDELRLKLMTTDDSGSVTGELLDSQAVTYQNRTWYRTVVDHATDGSIDVRVETPDGETVASVSGTDTTLERGGVGFGAASNQKSLTYYWDDLRLTDSGGADLQYSWQIDGQRYDGAVVDRTFETIGDYGGTVTVTGTNDGTDTASVEVSVTQAENQPPVPRIDMPETAPVGASVPIDGEDSTDADGSIVSYEWEIDGERKTGPVIRPTFDEAGMIPVKLAVTDDDGATARTSRVLEVQRNEPPIARIDAPTTAPIDEPIVFDGSASEDPDGDRLTHTWRIDGESYDGPRVRYSPTETGDLTVRLTVTDADRASASATATVTIDDGAENEPPKARFPARDVEVGSTLTLDGGDSVDPDGTIESYRWTVGDRTRSGSTAEVTFETPGTVDVSLTVTDDDGAADTRTRTIEVREDNVPPEPIFSLPGVIRPGQRVVLDGGEASDPDGSIRTYQWEVEEQTTTGETVGWTFDSTGQYPVTLTVTDDDGATNATTATATVRAANRDPTARIEVPDEVTITETITLDASESSDPDGTIQNYRWQAGGSSERGVTARTSFDRPRRQRITLTVTDDDGAVDTTETTVLVLDTGEPPTPVVDVHPARRYDDGYVIDAGEPIVFDASDTRPGDGEIVSYEWSLQYGVMSGETVRQVFRRAGSFTLRLRVRDERGSVAERLVPIAIMPRIGLPINRPIGRPYRLDERTAELEVLR